MRFAPLAARVLAALVALAPIVGHRAAASDDPAPAAPRSIYRIDPALDGAVTGAALAGIVLPALYARQIISRRCPCPGSEVNLFDRPAIGNDSHAADLASDVTLGLALGAPVLADALALRAPAVLVEDVVVFAETLAVAGVLVSAVKYTVQRPLPRVYDDHDPVLAAAPGGYRSFYSGHTTLVFAALGSASMTMGWRDDRWLAPWLATTIVGGSVAVERVAAGRHFPSDVIVGALTGTAVGIVVPWLHRRPTATSGVHLGLQELAGGGLALAARGRL